MPLPQYVSGMSLQAWLQAVQASQGGVQTGTLATPNKPKTRPAKTAPLPARAAPPSRGPQITFGRSPANPITTAPIVPTRPPIVPAAVTGAGVAPGGAQAQAIEAADTRPVYTPAAFDKALRANSPFRNGIPTSELYEATGYARDPFQSIGPGLTLLGNVATGAIGGFSAGYLEEFAKPISKEYAIPLLQRPADLIARGLVGAFEGAKAGIAKFVASTEAEEPEKPRTPIGTIKEFNGQQWQVAAHSEAGDPVYRQVGALTPGQQQKAVEEERMGIGFGPSGGPLLRYLDLLSRTDPARAAEVARFIASTPSARAVYVDDTGSPRQTQSMFQTGVFFTEKAYNAWAAQGFPDKPKGNAGMPRIATEQTWDVIASRNKWGITGAQFLEAQGYTNLGGGIWEKRDPPQITGYGGSFGNGGDSLPGFGFAPSSPFRNPLGMVNWRVT